MKIIVRVDYIFVFFCGIIICVVRFISIIEIFGCIFIGCMWWNIIVISVSVVFVYIFIIKDKIFFWNIDCIIKMD